MNDNDPTLDYLARCMAGWTVQVAKAQARGETKESLFDSLRDQVIANGEGRTAAPRHEGGER